MRTARQLSIFLLFISGIFALYAGYHMVSDPSGHSLGLPFYLLNGSVFSDYTMPGWVLLVTVGIFSLVAIACIFGRVLIYPSLIMFQGVIIIVFVIVQMLLLGETFIIQYFFLILGIGLIGLGILQNQRRIATDVDHKPHPPQKSHPHKHRRK
jgi:hypothetical protein